MFSAILLSIALADVRNCACDVAKPDTMEARECSLCREAEKQPSDTRIFFLKDVNPTKPNRLLALPRQHYDGPHSLSQMTAADRTELWNAAIDRAKSLWGDRWGIAYNGIEKRTQCHTHVHIGKLNDDAETAEGFVVVSTPSEISIPPDESEGLWIHPVAGKLHVHAGAPINETVLMR